MVPEKIFDILKDFTTNDYKSILIDGVWGIGKTFQINRFLKEYVQEKKNKKKLNVLYVSLFGKESIEDLHSELCIKGHPKKFKAKRIMKYAFKTISIAASITPLKNKGVSLDFNLGISDDKKIKGKFKNKNQINIVILDDLERKGLKLSYDSLLGYLNKLFLDGIKVAIICSEKEINSKDSELFNKFREKVFDRYYTVSMANKDIIKSYFKEDSEYLDNEIIELFENNLRIASKASKFYFEAKTKLNENNIEFYIGTLLWYSVLVVVEFNKFVLVPEFPLEERASPLEFYKHSEKIRTKLLSIKEYDNKVNNPFKYNSKSYNAESNHDIIEGIYYAYFYDDYDQLFNSFAPKDVKTLPVLKQNIFLLDCAGKKELINKKIKCIYEDQSLKFDMDLLAILSDLFEYYKFFPQNFDEEKLSNFLAEKYFGASNDLKEALKLFGSVKYKEFIEKVLSKNIFLSQNQFLTDLKEAFNSKDLNKVYAAVQNIRSSDFMKDKDLNFNKKFQDFVIENHYFLPNLSGTITQQIWDLAYQSCGLAIHLCISFELQDYLKSLSAATNDEDERDRIEALLKYGFISERWI